MKNILLSDHTARDIDGQIARVLKGLGDPNPPLDLREVRELLKLDRAYYTSADDSLLAETVSRLKIAGKQVIKRPSLLVDVVRKFELKSLYLPDRKRILLDKSQPLLKHRWMEAHEISHDIVRWHGDMMLGDDTQTLSPGCHAQLEAEANFAAGRLLFLRGLFVDAANDTTPGIAAVRELKGIFQNTLTTTLWRYIESGHPELPMVGVISAHPHRSRRPPEFDPRNPCRYCIQSPAFALRFGSVSERSLFRFIASYCGAQRGGPLGEAEIVLADDNGDRHVFQFETFYNQHEALTFAVYNRPYAISIAA